jgi:WD40 repeat protein
MTARASARSSLVVLTSLEIGGADQVAGVEQLWDHTTKIPLHAGLQQREGVWAIAFSPDRKAVVAAGAHEARLLDLAAGEEIGMPLVHPARVVAAAYSPDSKVLVTGSTDGTARLWSTFAGVPFGTPLQHRGAVVAIAFSPDGKMVLTASQNHKAQLWDVASCKPLGDVLSHDARWLVGRFQSRQTQNPHRQRRQPSAPLERRGPRAEGSAERILLWT